MKLSRLLIVITLYCIKVPLLFGNTFYNVKDFGARGDSVNYETQLIQTVIDKAASEGGGTVVVPPGIYKITCLELKDNVNLHLAPGSKLIASPDYQDYPVKISRYESRTNGLYAKYFVIYAQDAKNISITGNGIIDGNGKDHFQVGKPQNHRPNLVRLVHCTNVTIKDVKMRWPANWTCHLLGCKKVLVDGLDILTTYHEPGNRDGLDIDCCQDVTITNCRIISGDDAVVLKTTGNAACENIIINNCNLSSPTAAGIKIGTETNGDFRNITITNCIIHNLHRYAGISFMAVDGGVMENISVNNIVMNDVIIPIFIRLGNRARPYKRNDYVKRISSIRNISFSDIIVDGAKHPCNISGLNIRKIENLSFRNMNISYSNYKDEQFYPINDVIMNEFGYPELSPNISNKLPASAFYFKNVKNVYMQNISIQSTDEETRPSIIFDRADDLELHSVKAKVNPKMPSMIHFRNSSNIITNFCRIAGKNNNLFTAAAETNKDIHLENNFVKEGQIELLKIQDSQDIHTYDPIDDAKVKYTLTTGDFFQDHNAHDLKDSSFKIKLAVGKDKGLTPQLCILAVNNGEQSGNLKINYNGIEQIFPIDWKNWGWAPFSLVETVDKEKNIQFEISQDNRNSDIKISKIFVRYLKLGYTD